MTGHASIRPRRCCRPAGRRPLGRYGRRRGLPAAARHLQRRHGVGPGGARPDRHGVGLGRRDEQPEPGGRGGRRPGRAPGRWSGDAGAERIDRHDTGAAGWRRGAGGPGRVRVPDGRHDPAARRSRRGHVVDGVRRHRPGSDRDGPHIGRPPGRSSRRRRHARGRQRCAVLVHDRLRRTRRRGRWHGDRDGATPGRPTRCDAGQPRAHLGLRLTRRDRCHARRQRARAHRRSDQPVLVAGEPGQHVRPRPHEAVARRVRLPRERQRVGLAGEQLGRAEHHPAQLRLDPDPGELPQRRDPGAAGRAHRGGRSRPRGSDRRRQREHLRRLLLPPLQPRDRQPRLPLPPQLGSGVRHEHRHQRPGCRPPDELRRRAHLPQVGLRLGRQLQHARRHALRVRRGTPRPDRLPVQVLPEHRRRDELGAAVGRDDIRRHDTTARQRPPSGALEGHTMFADDGFDWDH